MKKLFVFLVVLFFAVSCGEKEKGTVKKEENQKTEQDTRIAPGKVGPFNLGDPAPETGAHDWFTIENVQEMENEEGVDYEKNYFYAVRDSLREVRMEESGGNIEEINVMGENYKTSKGIGVGSTLTQFTNSYTDYKIYYSYESENFWIETEEQPKTDFIIDPDGYKGDEDKLSKSDMVELKIDEFDKNAKITKIRLYR